MMTPHTEPLTYQPKQGLLAQQAKLNLTVHTNIQGSLLADIPFPSCYHSFSKFCVFLSYIPNRLNHK